MVWRQDAGQRGAAANHEKESVIGRRLDAERVHAVRAALLQPREAAAAPTNRRQDQGGGEYSGVYVFIGQAGGDIVPLVGDKVTITGNTAEFYDSTQLVLSNAENIIVTGEGDIVSTTVSNVTDWEPYEGVVVSLESQHVLSEVNNHGEVDITEGIPMDNVFFNFDT